MSCDDTSKKPPQKETSKQTKERDRETPCLILQILLVKKSHIVSC